MSDSGSSPEHSLMPLILDFSGQIIGVVVLVLPLFIILFL